MGDDDPQWQDFRVGIGELITSNRPAIPALPPTIPLPNPGRETSESSTIDD
jgi:hypothetical protein